MLGWLRRGGPAAPPGPARQLDALVALGPHHIPPGVTPGDAARAVKAGVAGLATAGLVTVEYHPARSEPDRVSWVELDETDRRRSAAFRLDLEALVAAVLIALPPGAAPPVPEPVSGFAEAPWSPRHAVPTDLIPPYSAPVPPAPADADLSDTALLQRLLAHATGVASGAAAPRVIERFGSLAHTLAAPGHELAEVPGLGEHSVAAIKLVHALALRSARGALIGQNVERNRGRLLAYLRSAIARDKVEQFRILFLDAAGRLQADEAQARGTVNHTPVYPREVVRRALELRAAALILVHNHPSGDPTPSRADLEMTAQIEAAGRVVGVAVLDHLIVVTGDCLSFRDEGLLANPRNTPSTRT